MRAIVGDRCTGRTTLLIQRICELQDEGADLVVVLVPEANYVNWWLPYAMNLPGGEGIDPSRCMLVPAEGDWWRHCLGHKAVAYVAEDVDRWRGDLFDDVWMILDTYTTT